VNKITYIYILSQRYSGSTLLSFLLATHPAIATIGERRKFYNKAIQPDQEAGQLCSCGATFQDCTYWTYIRDAVHKRLSKQQLSSNFTEFELFDKRLFNKIWDKLPPLGLFQQKRQQQYKANQVLVEEILRKANKSVFLDSSKTYKHLRHLSQIPEFDFQVIWLSRDPRAQVSSALKYNDWSIEKATRQWMMEMDTYQELLQRGAYRYLTLSYEQLCRQPQQEMERILNFVGLDANQFSLHFREQEQHIMGNFNMRLGKDSTIKERKDWLQRLSPAQIQQIEQLTVDYTEYYSST
jgi:hypothetical protein